MPVRQAIKDASARRLADGRRNGGDGEVKVTFYIHTFTVNEVLLSVKPLDS
jgi:hypothetical protein